MIGLLKIFNTVTSCVASKMMNSEYLATYITKMLSVVTKAIILVPNDCLIRTGLLYLCNHSQFFPHVPKTHVGVQNQKDIEKIFKSLFQIMFLFTANVGTALLLSQLHCRSHAANQWVIDFVKTQHLLMEQFEEETIISSIQFFTKVIKELGSTLSNDFIALFLEPDSYLASLKHSNSEVILKNLVVFYETLLSESMFQNEVFGLVLVNFLVFRKNIF